eukprot:m.408585 g.408585  ORF g.408585 m.408585 type:complete len:358 (+) comp56509_c0_seq3:1-1074(+)
MGEKKNAFVTLVMGGPGVGDAYIQGAAVLAFTLRQQKTTADIVLMVTDDVPAASVAAAARVFDHVVPVQHITATTAHLPYKRFQHMYTWLNNCLTKFRCLQLTQYRRVVFLDADMVAVSNPDSIFEVSAPAGICSIIKTPQDNEQFHGKPIDPKIIDNSLSDYGIRGCTLLLRPSENEFKRLMDHVASLDVVGDPKRHIGPDEFFITNYFRRYWYHLHSRFGCTSWKTEDVGSAQPVFLHFVSEKPWAYTKEWDDFKLWNKLAQQLVDRHPQMYDVLVPFVKRKIHRPIQAQETATLAWSKIGAQISQAEEQERVRKTAVPIPVTAETSSQGQHEESDTSTAPVRRKAADAEAAEEE